jgi:hypothetical protein
MMNERDQFAQKVEQLIEADHGHGHGIWCWLRRRAKKHYEVFNNDEELEGSSDVSNYLFELWVQWKRKSSGTINDGFGFWINSQICLEMDIPNVKATREFHNRERA